MKADSEERSVKEDRYNSLEKCLFLNVFWLISFLLIFSTDTQKMFMKQIKSFKAMSYPFIFRKSYFEFILIHHFMVFSPSFILIFFLRLYSLQQQHSVTVLLSVRFFIIEIQA